MPLCLLLRSLETAGNPHLCYNSVDAIVIYGSQGNNLTLGFRRRLLLLSLSLSLSLCPSLSPSPSLPLSPPLPLCADGNDINIPTECCFLQLGTSLLQEANDLRTLVSRPESLLQFGYHTITKCFKFSYNTCCSYMHTETITHQIPQH